MTHSPFLLMIGIVLLSACSADKLEKINPAITGFPTPVYDGMADVIRGSMVKTLPMHTIVYMMDNKLTVNDVEFVKIHFNDTVGYVATGWLLPEGQQGVVNSSINFPITIYNDSDLKVASGNTFSEVQMVSFKKAGDSVSQIIYFGANETTKPSFGYIGAPVLSDSLSLLFYPVYSKAFWTNKKGDPSGMNALTSYNEFSSSPLYKELFFGLEGEEGAYGDGQDAEGGNDLQVGHVEMEWRNIDGIVIDSSANPGKFELHYIWEDDVESDGNHLGDRLEQGVPSCASEGRGVKGYKMVFTPIENTVSATFSCVIPMIPDKFEKRIENMLPGDTYEFLITHNVYGVICDETTFLIKTNTGLTGKGMVHAVCGD